MPTDVDRMPMADIPLIIVLALGGAAVGGPEALFLLLAVAGQGPAADIIIVLFLICAMTAVLLGTMLLARFIRAAVANDVAALLAPGTERFARLTLAVALAVVVFVSACLLAIPAGLEREVGGAARSCSA
ncbi:hypothetical protein EJB05_54300, partial [Eragrostis curvula]